MNLVKTETLWFAGTTPDLADEIERIVDAKREEWQASEADNPEYFGNPDTDLDILAYVYQWNAEEDDILSSGILDEFTIVPGDFTYEIELRYLEAV